MCCTMWRGSLEGDAILGYLHENHRSALGAVQTCPPERLHWLWGVSQAVVFWGGGGACRRCPFIPAKGEGAKHWQPQSRKPLLLAAAGGGTLTHTWREVAAGRWQPTWWGREWASASVTAKGNMFATCSTSCTPPVEQLAVGSCGALAARGQQKCICLGLRNRRRDGC